MSMRNRLKSCCARLEAPTNSRPKFGGKIGEELFTGKYRFTVLNVQETSTYARRWANRYNPGKTIEAAPGEKLVVITARLKNGTKVKDEWAFTTGRWAGNTALTDIDERSYQPYDTTWPPMKTHLWALSRCPAPPSRLPLYLRCRQTRRLKIWCTPIVRYSERADNKGTDVRVSLAR
jgi:hypothetical protein